MLVQATSIPYEFNGSIFVKKQIKKEQLNLPSTTSTTSTASIASIALPLLKDNARNNTILHNDQKSMYTTTSERQTQLKTNIEKIVKDIDQTPQTKNIQGGTDTALSAAFPSAVVVARPLHELFAHVRHARLPSLQLIARVIKVLVCGIFKKHLCDRVLLTEYGQFKHSLKGRKIVSQNLSDIKKEYPYLLENAFFLVFKDQPTVTPRPANQQSTTSSCIGDSLYVLKPPFEGYNEINTQTIREYYHNFFYIDISDKEKHNTIQDLFKSQLFDVKKFENIFKK